MTNTADTALVPPDSGNPLRELAASPTRVVFDSSALYVDRVYSLEDVAARLAATPGAVADPRWFQRDPSRTWALPGGRVAAHWIGPPAFGHPDTKLKEVMRITFQDLSPFNQVALEVRNLACNFEVWYLDPVARRYRQMTDKRGEPIRGSVPGRRTFVADDEIGEVGEGQRRGRQVKVGGWLKFTFQAPTVVAKAVEIRFDRRVPPERQPRRPGRDTPEAYRISVRRIAFHLDICVRDDTPPEGVPYGDPNAPRVHRAVVLPRLRVPEGDRWDRGDVLAVGAEPLRRLHRPVLPRPAEGGREFAAR